MSSPKLERLIGVETLHRWSGRRGTGLEDDLAGREGRTLGSGQISCEPHN